MANGRYDDRLKVYKNNAWHNAKRVRVYKNGWIDLGDDQSSNTKELWVYKNGIQKRVTRTRHDEQKSRTIGAGYHQGSWSITTRQQYCFYNTGGAPNTRFYAFFKVKASGASKLFYFASSYFANTYFDSGINANGTVWYRVKDGGGNGSWSPSDNTHTTSAAIQMGFDKNWQTIEFIGDVGSNTLYVKVNGVSQGFSRHTAWSSNSNAGVVGSNSLRVSTDGTFKIDTAGYPFTSITEDTTTEYYTETTWV